MADLLSELLENASEPLSKCKITRNAMLAQFGSSALVQELSNLLLHRNGFFAYDKALHVWPFELLPNGYDLASWNAQSNWRSAFEGLADGCLFFAEDLFGDQFAIKKGEIVRFKPETGDCEPFADTVDGWIDAIMREPEIETGYLVARSWIDTFGVFADNERLVPKMFFVLGGGYELKNFYALDSAESLRFRAKLAVQISDVPDGQTVNFDFE